MDQWIETPIFPTQKMPLQLNVNIACSENPDQLPRPRRQSRAAASPGGRFSALPARIGSALAVTGQARSLFPVSFKIAKLVAAGPLRLR
jgi:hypothetical protein